MLKFSNFYKKTGSNLKMTKRVGNFRINKYLSIKLEENKTNIYVNNKLFSQCKFLLLEIPIAEMKTFDMIASIDEVAEKLNRSLEPESGTNLEIPPEVEFWGHCSNLQVWYENNYDTRLLHSNLAFPLLERLTEVGDSQAKKVFKHEIIKRFESGILSVIYFLLEQDYKRYLSREEYLSTILSIEEMEGLFKLEHFLNREINPNTFYNKSNKFYNESNTFTAEEKKITKINLSENNLTEFPELLFQFQYLKSLDLSYNKLTEIPNSIERFRNLRDLDLGKNQLTSLPESIFKLKSLTKLDLRSNPFASEEVQGIRSLYQKQGQNVHIVYGYDKEITITRGHGRFLIRKKITREP